MKNKILFSAGIFLSLISLSAFAWTNKPEFRWEQLYRYELRWENHQLYVNRFSAAFNYPKKQEHPLFKVTPYFEIRRNINRDVWERKELGVEIGKDITDWFYLGEAIQKGWIREDYRNYRDYEKRDYAESETRLLFSHALVKNKHINLEGFILDEYTYDFNAGAGVRNELAVGVVMPVGKYTQMNMHCRHIDRVHYYDSDTLEASATLVF